MAPKIRSSLDAVNRILKRDGVKEEHIKGCKKLPFYLLIKAMYERRHKEQTVRKGDSAIYDIVETYDKKKGGFIIGEKVLKLTPTDIRIILGVEGGDLEVPEFKRTYVTGSAWFKEQFPDLEGKLTEKDLKERIYEVLDDEVTEKSVENFAKLICILGLATIFYPSGASRIDWQVIGASLNLDQLKTYDWALDMCNTVMDRIKKGNSLKGCSCVLLPWFYEHVAWGDAPEPDAYPRYLRWNLNFRSVNFKKNVLKKIVKLGKEVKPGELTLKQSENEIIASADAEEIDAVPETQDDEGSGSDDEGTQSDNEGSGSDDEGSGNEGEDDGSDDEDDESDDEDDETDDKDDQSDDKDDQNDDKDDNKSEKSEDASEYTNDVNLGNDDVPMSPVITATSPKDDKFAQIVKLKKELKEEKMMYIELADRNKELKKENETMSRAFDSLKKENETMSRAFDSLKKRNALMQNQIKKQQEELQKKDGEIRDLGAVIKEKSHKQTAEHGDQDIDGGQLRDNHEKLVEEHQMLVKKYEDLSEKNNSLLSELEEERNQNKILNSQLDVMLAEKVEATFKDTEHNVENEQQKEKSNAEGSKPRAVEAVRDLDLPSFSLLDSDEQQSLDNIIDNAWMNEKSIVPHKEQELPVSVVPIVGDKRKGKLMIEPSSLVKRMKGETRKKKVDEDFVQEPVGKKKKIKVAFEQLNEESVLSSTPTPVDATAFSEDMKLLEKVAKDGENTVVWKLSGMSVSVADCFSMSRDEGLSTEVVNAMFFIVNRMFASKKDPNEKCAHGIHLSPQCMVYLNNDMTEKIQNEITSSFRTYHVSYKLVFIPIKTTSGPSTLWTLLCWDINEGTFTHYNPMKSNNTRALGGKANKNALKMYKFLDVNILQESNINATPSSNPADAIMYVTPKHSKPKVADSGIYMLMYATELYERGEVRMDYEDTNADMFRKLAIQELLKDKNTTEAVKKYRTIAPQ